MKRWNLGIAVMVMSLAGLARAQGVDAVLAQFPAKDPGAEQTLCAQLVKGGMLEEVCKRIVPAGSADDTHARYAVAAMTRYAGRAGAEAERAAYAKALLEALHANADPEPKALFMQQLQFIGHDEAVEALASYLLDENVNLAQSAADALVGIRSPAATAAIVKALATAPPGRLAILLHAAADLRAEAAADAVRRQCMSEDAVIKGQALFAAASLPLPDAQSILSKAIASETRGSVRAQEISLYFLFARRYAQTGHAQEAAALCRDMIRSSEKETHVRSAALATLVDIAQAQALPDLLAAADSADSDYRNAALAFAAKIPGEAATQQWIAKAAQGPAENRVDVIAMLGERHDPAAAPALASALSDKEPAVRLAAIAALEQLSGEKAIPDLIKFLQTAAGEELKAATEALSRMPGEPSLAAVAAALPNLPAPARIALLDMLGARGAITQRKAIFEQARAPEEAVRLAALRALARAGRENELPRIVALALAAKTDAELSAALKAVTSVGADVADPAVRSAAMIAALPETRAAQRVAFLHALAKLGGAPAIDAVAADLKNPQTFDAAVRSLADATDPAALPHLLQVAMDPGTDTSHYVLAMRGLVNLAKSPSLAQKDRIERLKAALAACRRPEEKKLVLSALSSERTLESLNLIAPALDDPQLKPEAALAVVRLILPQKQGQQGLSGPDVKRTLQKAIAACPDPKLKEQATRYLAKLKD